MIICHHVVNDFIHPYIFRRTHFRSSCSSCYQTRLARCRGQEAGLNKRLAFFDKDLIEWKDHEFTDLYKKLFAVKKAHPALWAGEHGGKVVQIPIENNTKVFAYSRTKGDDKVLVLLNFSDTNQSFVVQNESGIYQELFTEHQVQFTREETLELRPWGYQVFVKQ